MEIDVQQYIRNRERLSGHGNASLREAAIDILDHALWEADPYHAVKALMRLEGDRLTIGDREWDLSAFERIFVLGAGKASRRIGEALEEILGDRIDGGVFVLKHGDRAEYRRARVIYASHPVPDENSFQGARLLMSLASQTTERDLVLAAITGGSSALLALPVEGVSFRDIQEVNRLLLLSGASIFQINAVRKHLSRIKGGWLAKAILPATLINLTVSDVVGDALDYITGPTVPDTSTFEDARAVLDEYELWDAFPPAASSYLRGGGEAQETPKHFKGMPLYSYVVVPGDAACQGAARRAEALGFSPFILTTMLGGEARDTGLFFGAIGKELAQFGRPFKPPCALIVGGENVVTIRSDNRGDGGPNQEFALAGALEIESIEKLAIAAVDTDGIDGASEAAGALVDGASCAAARALGMDPRAALRSHDVHPLLDRLGDTVVTGPTGTNVNDLKLLLVS